MRVQKKKKNFREFLTHLIIWPIISKLKYFEIWLKFNSEYNGKYIR